MTWGLMAGNFGVIYVLYLYSTWLPGYLEIERHLSIKSAGLLSAVPFALSMAGSIGGGFLVDHLGRRGVRLMRAQTDSSEQTLSAEIEPGFPGFFSEAEEAAGVWDPVADVWMGEDDGDYGSIADVAWDWTRALIGKDG